MIYNGIKYCFQVAAELLGIRLTKAEQEQQQPVVKAEIVTYGDNGLAKAIPSSPSNSSVCRLM